MSKRENKFSTILDTIKSIPEEMGRGSRVSLDAGKDTARSTIIYSYFYFQVKEDARKKRSSKNNGKSQPCLVLSVSVKSFLITTSSSKRNTRTRIRIVNLWEQD
jgi:hypothetical protein